MDALKKAYYRSYQEVFNIGARCLRWRKPVVVTGAGSLAKIPALLSESRVKKAMVVTGSHVVKSLGPCLLYTSPSPRDRG